MKESMSCPKCKASKAALYRNRRPLEGGSWVDETSCLLCGWVDPQPVQLTAPVVDVNRPADRPTTKVIHKAACTLEGCDGHYIPVNSKHHLCRICATKMQRWRLANKGTPSPLIKQGNGWITNPERKGAA